MGNEERESPRPQHSFGDVGLKQADAYEFFLHRSFEQVGLQFDTVKTVLDLYCGNGTLTLGSILCFPNAQIHAIDIHKVLVPDAVNHPRVTFHKGWLPETLSKKSIPCADIVLMSYAGRLHGFNELNISLLSSHVGKYLFTVGDNYDIEGEPWFRGKFDCLMTDRDHFSAIWKPK